MTDEAQEEPQATESDTEIDLLAESDSDSEDSNNGKLTNTLNTTSDIPKLGMDTNVSEHINHTFKSLYFDQI